MSVETMNSKPIKKKKDRTMNMLGTREKITLSP